MIIFDIIKAILIAVVVISYWMTTVISIGLKHLAAIIGGGKLVK